MFGNFGSEVLVQSALEQGVQDGEGGFAGCHGSDSLGYLGAGVDASAVGFHVFQGEIGTLLGVHCGDFGKPAEPFE